MSETAEAAGNAKSRSVAGLETSAKLLSAVGVVALGVAGLWFQATTASRTEAEAKRARDARRYLPMIRAYTEVEVAAGQVAVRLRGYLSNPSANANVLMDLAAYM